MMSAATARRPAARSWRAGPAVILGLRADYLSRWQANLGYTRFAGDGNELADRDFISASVKYSFLRFRGHDLHECHESDHAPIRCRAHPRIRPRLSRNGRAPCRPDRAPRSGPDPAGRRTGRQRRRHHPRKWTGGITEPPAGYTVGEHHRDPYAGDQPLFTISAADLDEHRDRLSIGHQRMLETYPSFEMQVYPTRRSASVPQRIYDATRTIAATAKLVDDGNGVDGAVIGIPFPDPRQRPGGDLEPSAALPGRDRGVRRRSGRGDPRGRLHAGQEQSGDRAALLAAGHDARRARQHDDLLQAERCSRRPGSRATSCWCTRP